MSAQRPRPSTAAGAATALAAVAAVTLVIEPLSAVAPVESLGVVYIVAVLLVATVWGGPLGPLTALGSAAAFNWFHLPPTGRFHLAEGENWVALIVLLVTAVVASRLAERARARAEEAEARRGEADLAVQMARLLLRGGRLVETLPAVSARLAEALQAPGAAIRLGDDAEGLPLTDDGARIGALAGAAADRVERIVPALEALLAAALERDALLADVVETAALRRSDVLKTALLRSVSHDLRSPLTSILTAQAALGSRALSREEHDELVGGIGSEATRLSRLIDKLLDLSLLEAQAVPPHEDWCSVPEVIDAALDHLGAEPGTFRLSVDRDVPLVRADAAQLERAFSNLLENAARFAGGHPVAVRVRQVGRRLVVRIVDRGPGIDEASLERIFEPFVRGAHDGGHRGSGLGLAIVRGLVEVNGGRTWAESVPGQGTTFVVELPLAAVPAPAGSAA